MKDELINLETAKMARDKGFDIPILNCYSENGEVGDTEMYILTNFNGFNVVKGSNTNMYSAPTQTLLQRWLREKHEIFIEVYQTRFGGWLSKCRRFNKYKLLYSLNIITSNSYEEVFEISLMEGLKLIENEKHIT